MALARHNCNRLVTSIIPLRRYVVVKVHGSWSEFREYFMKQEGEKRLLAFTKRGTFIHSLKNGDVTALIWGALPQPRYVRTQAMYQLLDPGFIGLIFSCFSEDAQKVGRIQVTAFRSLDGKQSQISRLSPANKVKLDGSLERSDIIVGCEFDQAGDGITCLGG
ncbi:lys-63-specific deubiquitinase brcc36 [Phtheirospermum japonicum]|uniref:Lys-63-specific deubiquitinase brcc36 n=1 Tax=Phtheirospermum japonicum TaxID=374723 RepID=A0A830BRZ2_9LAMI|nr:lys-63-specific deubiquitinase brcc36 [Phtheirospermum japonicum]